jgi:hypothetical protein
MIGFVGRFASIAIGFLFVEAFITMGQALDFEHYSAMGIVFQCLVFFVVLWIATEWHYDSLNK